MFIDIPIVKELGITACLGVLLMIVTNNRYGISTPYAGQHGYEQIAERGKAFGMPTAVVDGNDPEASWGEFDMASDPVSAATDAQILVVATDILVRNKQITADEGLILADDTMLAGSQRLDRVRHIVDGFDHHR